MRLPLSLIVDQNSQDTPLYLLSHHTSTGTNQPNPFRPLYLSLSPSLVPTQIAAATRDPIHPRFCCIKHQSPQTIKSPDHIYRHAHHPSNHTQTEGGGGEKEGVREESNQLARSLAAFATRVHPSYPVRCRVKSVVLLRLNSRRSGQLICSFFHRLRSIHRVACRLRPHQGLLPPPRSRQSPSNSSSSSRCRQRTSAR